MDILPSVNINGLELSDLFFNYPNQYNNTIAEQAKDFLTSLPSLKKQGITIEMLVSDYLDRV
jgi:hypothetical protein